ncbi:right-handed parallel beta-helix repeat-containing protein [Novosphingobium sp.]|uniref:right-handed parallel beta-helix repeat-containing protein n=1 Tax=Novosphingobium sp. TaxID=1874826 RepID=UPI003B515BE4
MTYSSNGIALMALTTALAAVGMTVAETAMAQPGSSADTRALAVEGTALARSRQMIAGNTALSQENQIPTSFRNVVSLTDPDVAAQAQALSDKAGHGGLYLDYYRFAVAVNKVRSKNADLFDIPKGIYHLYPPVDVPSYMGVLEFANLSHVVVDGHGSTLLFAYLGKREAPLTKLHLRGGISITHSDHFTLRNVIIDYDEPLAVPVTVAGNPGSQTLTVDRAYPIDPAMPIPLTIFIPFDLARRTFNYSNDMSPGDFSAWFAEHARDGAIPYTCPPPVTGIPASACFRYAGGQTYAFAGGERLSPVPPTSGNFFASVRDNNYSAVVVEGNSANINLEGLTIWSSPGQGIVVGDADKAIHIAHCRIVRKPDTLLQAGERKRLISTLSDGIDVLTSRGDVVIDDSEIGNQADDGLNIRGALRNGTAIGHATIQAPSSGDGSYWRVGGLVDVFGDKGNRTIASGVAIARVDPPAQGKTLYTIYLGPGSAAMQPGQTYAIAPRDWGTSNVVVRNTWFHDNSERGIILHGNNIAVLNNRFDRTAESAVQILYENKSGELEGLPATNVVIAGNVIHDVNVHWFGSGTRSVAAPAAIAVYMERRADFAASSGLTDGDVVPRHIVISDNTIDKVPGAGILVSQADDVTLERNHVSSTGLHNFGQAAIDGNAILVEHVTRLHAADNSADARIVLPVQ